MTRRDPDADDAHLWDEAEAEARAAVRYCPECHMTGGHVSGCPNDDAEPEDE